MSKKETKEENKQEKEEISIDINVEELGKAGLHFGHSSSKRHPNMEPYIDGVKGEVHILDLTKTAEKLEQALVFLAEQKRAGKEIMIVGTKPQTEQIVKETAKKHNLPYITYRWIGGFITNFDEVKKRIKHLNELLEKREAGDFDKYTKKEQLEIDREIEKLEKKFGGVKKLTSIPDIIFCLNMDKDEIAIEEAKQKEVKIVAVCDTNCDPMEADYPIPANDDAISSIKLILDKFDEIIS
ncbi:MAG: 30S ribosomal protein S2 [Patescibacteria group bacterium]